jgi:hypothetical protein
MKEALEEASDFTLGLARIQEDDLSRFTEDMATLAAAISTAATKELLKKTQF